MGATKSVQLYVSSNQVGQSKSGVTGWFCGCGSGVGVLDGTQLPQGTKGTKKEEIIQDSKSLFQIDEHALNAPDNAGKNLIALAKYLGTPFQTDLEKVRAIYRWITNNMSYDEAAFVNKANNSTDTDTVLKMKRGSADAFSTLFAALCKEMNIPVEVIRGHAKGFHFDAENPFTEKTKPEHIWNAVFVESEWRFVDCTWGCGYADDSGKFQRKFEEFWFLTDPEKFINDHFPIYPDQKAGEFWQLLPKAITLAEFNRTIKMEEVTKEWGIEFSHKEPVIIFRKELNIIIRATKYPLRCILATLDTTGGVNIDNYSCVHRIDNATFKIQVKPPTPGVFKLTLFGKRDDDFSTESPGLVKYTLKCTDVTNCVRQFPYSYAAAQTYQSCLHEPMFRDLPQRTKVKFRLTSPGLQAVKVEKIPLKIVDTNTWEAEVLTSEKGDSIVVFGSASKEGGRYHELYKFNVI
ncbi:hypothetical protein ScPMuIL_017929 [Solemya velum]